MENKQDEIDFLPIGGKSALELKIEEEAKKEYLMFLLKQKKIRYRHPTSEKVKKSITKEKKDLLRKHVGDGWSYWSFVSKVKIGKSLFQLWHHYDEEVDAIRMEYLEKVKSKWKWTR